MLTLTIDGYTLPNSTKQKINPGDSVSISASYSGTVVPKYYNWEIISISPSSETFPELTYSGDIYGETVTYTHPSNIDGCAILLKCTMNSARLADNTISTDLITTTVITSKSTSNYYPFAPEETTERGANGWIDEMNSSLSTANAYMGGMGTSSDLNKVLGRDDSGQLLLMDSPRITNITADGYIGIGTSFPATGDLRLKRYGVISVQGGSGDSPILKTATGDSVYVGLDSAIGTTNYTVVRSPSRVSLTVNGTDRLYANSTGITTNYGSNNVSITDGTISAPSGLNLAYNGSTKISVGSAISVTANLIVDSSSLVITNSAAPYASVGHMRTLYGFDWNARNFENSADCTVIGITDSSGTLYFGPSTYLRDPGDSGSGITILRAPVETRMVIDSTTIIGATADRVNLEKPLTVARSTNTIASGVITVTGNLAIVETEASAATDNLDTINGGDDGQILYLKTVNSARDVVLTETGNIKIGGGTTLTIGDADSIVTLIYTTYTNKWHVAGYSGGCTLA